MNQDETAQIFEARRESEDNESESNRDKRHLHWKLCVQILAYAERFRILDIHFRSVSWWFIYRRKIRNQSHCFSIA